MKPIAKALVLVAGLFVVSRLVKAAGISTLKFTSAYLETHYSGLNVILIWYVNVQNVSNTNFTIRSLAGDFFVNGTYTANISQFKSITVSANSSQVYPIEITMGISGALSQVLDVLTGKSKLPTQLRFKGNVNLDSTVVPLDLTYNLVPEQLLNAI